MPSIIGTAGHIDHGKTQLIKALTGQDTDRLKEEKERGISIDLGFASMELVNGERAGVVDVPGHERFIRNMLAGAHGIDCVLLVVAADDGVMPQTEEHLDIVHLLGVSRGVVAITKIDLVDEARVAEVQDEVEILVAGTVLEGAPIVPVCALTGDGLERLRAILDESLSQAKRDLRAGGFRLPVDRAFVMRGHGTVVTGTAVSGSVRPGDTLRILPGGDEVRVRSVQVHDHDVDEAARGQRVALNLTGADRSRIERGQVVCDVRYDLSTDRFDARVEVRGAKPIKSHTRIRLHLGTAEVLGKIVWLDSRRQAAAREGAYGQLILHDPVHTVRGDRFILRNETAQRTIGGGVVVHPFARRHRAGEADVSDRLERLRAAADPASIVRSLLDLEVDLATELSWLAQAGGMSGDEVRSAVIEDSSLRPLPAAAGATAGMTVDRWRQLQDTLVNVLRLHHQAEPLATGMEMESLRGSVARGLSQRIFRAFVDAIVGEGIIVREESLLRLPSHRVALEKHEADIGARAEALIAAGGVTPVGLKEVEKSLNVPRSKLQAILKQLEREGRIAQVDADLCFATAAVEHARSLLRAHAEAHGEIDAATFRDLLGASRKYSIALLDYFDRTGFTLRVGDVRRLRRG